MFNSLAGVTPGTLSLGGVEWRITTSGVESPRCRVSKKPSIHTSATLEVPSMLCAAARKCLCPRLGRLDLPTAYPYRYVRSLGRLRRGLPQAVLIWRWLGRFWLPIDSGPPSFRKSGTSTRLSPFSHTFRCFREIRPAV